MGKIMQKRCTAPVVLLFLFFTLMLLVQPRPAASGGGEVVSGPYSLTIRGGAYSDSATFGGDARADYIKPFLNVHLFGTFDWLEGSNGVGEYDSQRFGAGIAFSHTYPGKANVFFGTSFINELEEYFGHAYLGGKVKVSDNALLSASYGQGLGPDMKITKNLTKFLTAKSANWAKAGAVYVAPGGIKTNLYYYLIDPGGVNISGLEGEVSYFATESISVGVTGSGDFTTKTDLDRNWSAQAFVAYAFGSQKGALIDVALDKNNPIAYPFVMRPSSSLIASAQCTLSISPGSEITSCGGADITFTASGGTPDYYWSTTSGADSSINAINATQATWTDGSGTYLCEELSEGGGFTVTVYDDNQCSATATVTVLPAPR